MRLDNWPTQIFATPLRAVSNSAHRGVATDGGWATTSEVGWTRKGRLDQNNLYVDSISTFLFPRCARHAAHCENLPHDRSVGNLEVVATLTVGLAAHSTEGPLTPMRYQGRW